MRNIVTGNWKSNKLWDDAEKLMVDVATGIHESQHTDIFVAPPTPYLAALKAQSTAFVGIAGQQCSAHTEGAFTGEHTASMLKSAGAKAVLIGHSERRGAFGESDAVVEAKVHHALDAGLLAIVCCGENLEERDAGQHFEKVLTQLSHAFQNIDASRMSHVVVAYEPIWAIGTGRTASAVQAQEMHAAIRHHLVGLFGASIAESMRILYGGSCKPSNALEIFMQPDVNGGLIGGASLNASDFLAIVAASNEAASKEQQGG